MSVSRVLLFLFGLSFVACSTHDLESFQDESLTTSKQEVLLSVSSLNQTRTSIDPEDMATTRWDKDDRIYVWATSDGGATYHVEATKFALKYFSPSFSSAVFIGNVAPMNDGEYNYFGVYPEPTSVNGTNVTYNIPSIQNGAYDGALDILAANPTTGDPLAAKVTDDFGISFRHMTHAIRINIPGNRNLLGGDIARLEITFPAPVVGDLNFDASVVDVEGQLSSGTSSVILDLENPLREADDYAWVFVSPTQLSGEMSFKAYNALDVPSEAISVNVNKTLEAGRVTPITLTVPTMPKYLTAICMSIGENYLGETPQFVTITAPEGAQFVDGSTSVKMPYNERNVYTTFFTHKDYGDIFRGGNLGVTFESESAIVVADSISLADINLGGINQYTCDVPYLMSNDFSGVTESFERGTNPGGSSAESGIEAYFGDYGITDWTADRGGAVEGTSIRTMCRLEGGMWVQALYRGRIDSAPLSAIKDGKSVKIKVTYKYSGSKNEYAGSNKGTAKFTHGYTTITGCINGNDGIENQIGDTMDTGDDGSYTSITRSGGYTTESVCGNTTRLSWRVSVDRPNEFAQGGNYWLYLDDVTVQIVK